MRSSSWLCSTRHSIMQYGIVHWGGSASALRAVFVEQKRLVRCLAGVQYWPGQEPLCSCRPLFALPNLLPMFLIYLIECCKFARRYPNYFQRIQEMHSHNTRNKAELYVVACIVCNFAHESRRVCRHSIMLSLRIFVAFEVIRGMSPCWKICLRNKRVLV
jgi:hypothetical protein